MGWRPGNQTKIATWEKEKLQAYAEWGAMGKTNFRKIRRGAAAGETMMAEPKPLKPPLRLSEADIQKQILDCLLFRGWYPKRTHVGRFILPDRAVLEALHRAGVTPRWIPVGEPGDADYVVLHGTYPGFFMETKTRTGAESRIQKQKAAEIQLGYSIRRVLIRDIESLLSWLSKFGQK